MSRGLPFVLLGVLVLLVLPCACGGGSGVGPRGLDFPPPPPGEPPGTSPSWVLVEPVTPLAFEALLGDLGGTDLGPIEGLAWHRVQVPEGQTPAGYVTQLEADVRVLAADLDVGLSAPEGDGRTIPAGGILFSVDLANQPELQRIGLGAAQGRATGQGVVVAVLDSGVVPEHAFLQGRLAPGGRDFVDDDPDPREEANGLDDDEDGLVDEGYGHGTFVASLVLAVAPGAQVVPLRVLGSDLFGSSSGVAAAIGYAANLGVDVIHLSVELPAEVRVVRDAVEGARALGIAVIGSAGNTGAADVGPAESAGGAFLVTSVGENDVRAPFASFGPGVALSAPGVDVSGAYPWDDPDTAIWSGTSFSAPLVSGAYALLRELDPLAPPDLILDHLRATAVDVDGLNPDAAGAMGSGRLDLDAATAP